MKTKPVIPRELADRDVDAALGYYLIEATGQAALGFVDALESAHAHISRHPATGSPRYAHELNLPGLRYWPVTRHPYLVVYLEQENHIAVWRLLHEKRDIPAWLNGNDGS